MRGLYLHRENLEELLLRDECYIDIPHLFILRLNGFLFLLELIFALSLACLGAYGALVILAMLLLYVWNIGPIVKYWKKFKYSIVMFFVMHTVFFIIVYIAFRFLMVLLLKSYGLVR